MRGRVGPAGSMSLGERFRFRPQAFRGSGSRPELQGQLGIGKALDEKSLPAGSSIAAQPQLLLGIAPGANMPCGPKLNQRDLSAT
jgi:hypothetical protein